MGRGPIKVGLVCGVALAGPALQVENDVLMLYVTSVKSLGAYEQLTETMEG